MATKSRDYARQARATKHREDMTDINWDADLAFAWLWVVSGGGYSIGHINQIRRLNQRPMILYNGCYKERYEK